jgi:RNA polymerase sigma factor (sigma-70 family)
MSVQVTPQRLHKLSDGELVELAQTGDRDAFAELYERYFDRVYDFLTRMMRNRSEAEDITQDTFIRAMNSLGKLDSSSSFKSWLFTIARNTALNRLKRSGRSRPMPVVGDDSGDTLELYIVDSDRLGNPQDAVQAEAVASLVWEAASGLNPKQYSLLDLHIRQGLDSSDIAEVLNVNRNNAYVMLNRMKAALAETVTAYIMMNEGRLACPELDTELNKASIGRFSPSARKVVTRHVDSCAFCQERQAELVSPVAILGALVPAPAAVGVKDSIRDNVLGQWPAAGFPAEPASGISSAFDPRLLLSLASIVVGIAILAGLIGQSVAGGGSDSAQAQSGTAMTLVFTGADGTPVEGVGVQLFTIDDGQPAFGAVTDSAGTLSWDDAGSGTYDLVIERLPSGVDLTDAERVWRITIEAGERLVLTASLQSSSD